MLHDLKSSAITMRNYVIKTKYWISIPMYFTGNNNYGDNLAQRLRVSVTKWTHLHESFFKIPWNFYINHFYPKRSCFLSFCVVLDAWSYRCTWFYFNHFLAKAQKGYHTNSGYAENYIFSTIQNNVNPRQNHYKHGVHYGKKSTLAWSYDPFLFDSALWLWIRVIMVLAILSIF